MSKTSGPPAEGAAGSRPCSDAPGLTHFDAAGAARMVDVGAKAETRRVAVAEGCIQIGRAHV